VDDPAATLNLGGQPLSLDPSGAFTVQVPLKEGQNGLAFLATDAAGNTGRLDASIIRDTVAPLVTFITPLEGLLSNAPSLAITGTVNDPSASFTVNGQAVPLTAQGAFSLVLAPPEGPFSLVGTATDAAGNVGLGERHLILDRTAPTITLDPVPPSLVSGSSLALSGRVDDPRATLSLNGQGLALDANGAFSLELPLAEGLNAFLLLATDQAGNAGRLEAATTRDSLAPVVHFTNPAEGLPTNARQIQLSGQVDDLGAAVLVDGQPMALDATGFFSTPIETIEGPMSFKATATDAAGNRGEATRTILVDWTAPRISLDAAPPALTSALAHTFRGQLDDPSATLTVNGIAVLVAADGRFGLDLPLIEGANPFHLEATDPAGNLGTLDAAILRDTIAPQVRLDAPAEGLLTHALQIEVRGQVDDPSAALQVNGQAVSLDAAGRFSLSLSPAEGPLTIQALALDQAGNAGQDLRHLVIDRTAPRISLTRPVPPLTRNPSLDLQGQVDDPGASLTLNGAPLPLDASGSFTASLPLAEGPNGFTLLALDRAGNSGSLAVVTVLDTQAPLLQVHAPAEGLRTRAAQVLVTGAVDDPLAQVKVNGQATGVDGNGAFSAALSPAEGPLLILVTATDPIGNQGQETRHIHVDRTAPRITLARPVPALVAVTSLTLQGQVDDPTARLTFNGAALALDAQGAFLVEASLSEGANAFHFEATDATGNIGVLDAKTLRDTIAPTLSLDSPQDGLITHQRSLLVKGRVDDPTARLLVAGQSLSPAADGSFELSLSPAEGPLMIVALATDPAGNTGHAVRSVTLDWTPPQLAWTAPTPAEGAKVGALPLAVAATVSENAAVALNGQALGLENGVPYLVKTSLSPAEGPLTLSLEATDRAGNTTRIERHVDVGLAAPKVFLEAPAEGLQTQEASALLMGRVECGEFLKPLTLTMNGNPVAVAPDGRFSLPVQLLEGANPFTFTATNAFGLQGRATRTLNRFTSPFGVQIDWPLEGIAIPESSVEVRGRVRRAECTVSVNGIAAPVDPASLTFTAMVPLQPGSNTLRAQARDGAGNQGEAQVRITCAPPADPSATFRWDLPAHASASRTRQVHVQGQADLPGVASVKVNGLPMSLSGLGREGRFEGDVPLEARGRNVLFLEVRTLTGTTLTERREVGFVPELPRIRLQAPETARPGDSIPIQVSPEPGTQLKGADVSWNGRFLARVADPFAPLTAQVPADAVVGSRILVEALATDGEGEQVTARTYVTVYGQGALLVEAYDDRLGLLLKEGLAAVEGGEVQALNATGKAALRTALPQNWILVSRTGYTPVWRPAGLQVGGVQSVVDARLTPFAEGQAASTGTFTGRFGQGTLELTFPAGAFLAEGQLSVTPLSTQGLPALLPLGWSAVSAWWVDAGALRPAYPGAASLTLSSAAPRDNLVWARFEPGLHAWMALATGLRASDLAGLPLPATGGYALVVPDAGATAPPAGLPGAQLPAFEGTAWREGLQASGTVDPAILATTAAIRGARATAKFSLGFDGKDPVPSGAILQVDVLESYALLDAALIEPDGFTQDAVLSHWILGVDKEGAPTLRAAQDLGLELPVRMSRSFQENELVDGRIWVGFYHDGVQVAQSGSELLDASGGVVSHDGIQLTLPSRALSGTTLIRINADQGDLASLWPDLAGQGSLVKSFQLDIVGTVSQGLGLSFDGLSDVPETARPLLVARRVIQGERLVVALGSLRKQGSNWALVVPEGGNPVLEGGAFAVLVPALNWDWISGTALLPGSIAKPLMKKLGSKARMASVKGLKAYETGMKGMKGMKGKVPGSSFSLSLSPASPSSLLNNLSGDAAVADVVVNGGFLQSVSGPTGAFAVPAFIPVDATSVPVNGARRDLGVTGSFTAPAPSAGNALRLAQVPFRVMTLAPAELAEVGVGTVVEVQLSTAADPATLGQAKLYQEATDAPQLVEVALRRTLSQDGRTLLLTPEAPLQLGASYRVVTTGLASVSGEAAPAFTRRFKTQSQPQFPDVDLSRIRLSYPTEAFDVTVTIPEGALPPWSIVSVEAPDMGSFGQGVMPPRGDLVFLLKASLGERLKVLIQLRDGRTLSGTIGRYVSGDGRTTLGPDGGRVEGPGGLAVAIPAGALDQPVEIEVTAADQDPVVAEGILNPGETLLRGIRLRAKGDVTFKKQPILEIPASSLPDLLPQGATPEGETELFGNGPLAIFQEQKRILPDGTEDVFHVLVDTAQFSPDGKLIQSLGGLRVPDPEQGTVIQQLLLPPSAKGRAQVPPSAKPQPGAPAPGHAEGLFGGFGDTSDWISEWNMAILRSTYYYHSGTVYRNWNGSGACNGTASASCYGPLANGEIHRYAGTVGLDAARKGRLARGRMLAVADAKGRYMNVGGPIASMAGVRWISLFAVDPRTGETSLDPGSPTPPDLGLPWERRNHSLAITSQGGNPFDPTLTAPRIRAVVVDANGEAQTLFAVGSTGKLRIKAESGSQPVVRGKVSGSITQDFGSLPAELPVTFTTEGTWKADIQGWSAKPVLGSTSLSVIVTPVGVLDPGKPGKPTLLSRAPSDGDQDVDPSSVVKITFSEPVRGATSSAFSIEVNTVKVPFKVVSGGREVSSDTTLVQEVWLMPEQRMTLGATVRVSLWSSLLSDIEGLSPDPASWSFSIRGAEEVGSLAGVGTFTQMAVHKGKIYAAEDVGSGYQFDGNGFAVDAGLRKQGIRVIDATDPSNPTKGPLFGEFRSWDPPTEQFKNLGLYQGPFAKSSITGLRVVTGVGIGGKSRDVLLVATRPWSVQEILYVMEPEWGGTAYKFRHGAIWAFDITGDAESTEVSMENSVPRLLMSASQGTLSENWIKAIGGVGGMLGSIRLRGGMTIWDADKWKGSWDQDQATLSDWTIRYRTAGTTGYYPDPKSLVASNGFYNATEAGHLSVLSGAFCEEDDGKPVAYAAMGYSEGLLAFIEAKVGDPLSMATFTSGGPRGMDGRIHDLSFAVNREYAGIVDTLKGTWQGSDGAEQGNLLVVGTQVPTGGRLWILKPSRGAVGEMGAVQMATADLPARITRLQADPARMLLGVEAGGRGYVFDLKALKPTHLGPMKLSPIYEFAVGGAWVMANGLLYDDQLAEKKVVIRNLDAMTIDAYEGMPIQIAESEVIQGAMESYGLSPEVPAPSAAPIKGKPQAASAAAPPIGEQYLYAMAKVELDNNGFPWLRYYYPDLTTSSDPADPNRGKMQLSILVDTVDSALRDRIKKEPGSYGVQIKAWLAQKGTALRVPFDVTHLKVVNNTPTFAGSGATFISPLSTDGDFSKLNLLSNVNVPGRLATKTTGQFFYVPFEFRLPDDLRAAYESKMQQDESNAWRVEIEAYVREKDATQPGGYKSKDQPDKKLQFIVKYNATTTLFDIAKGGVWHWDPKLSGNDPKNLDQNAATVALVNGDPALKSRASITPELYKNNLETNERVFDEKMVLDPLRYTANYQPNSDGTVSDNGTRTRVGTYGLQDAKLDMIQVCMDIAARGLRQKRPKRADLPYLADLQPEPSFDRPSYFQWTNGSLSEASAFGDPAQIAGDGLGGFGYRTLAFVNALQQFTPEEAGSAAAKGRNLVEIETWAQDPATTPSDLQVSDRPEEAAQKDFEPFWRIMPALRQGLIETVATPKGQEKRFSKEAMYFHYLAAYPGTRAFTAAGGMTYPISSLITRELVFGPSKTLKGWASMPTPSGTGTLGGQREEIDKHLATIRSTEDRKDPKAIEAFAQLAGALERQDILTLLSDKREKEMFNPGIGILQLALSKSWLRFPQEAPTVERPPMLNENQLFITAPPTKWNYVDDEHFNDNYYDEILAFLTQNRYEKTGPIMKNWRAGRVDILINGVATGASVLKGYLDHMQKGLTAREAANGAPWTKRVEAERPKLAPFIVSYNISRKKRQGAYAGPWYTLNFWDAQEMFGDWTTPLESTHRIDKVGARLESWRRFNPDAIRLIGILRATVQALRSDTFKSKFYPDQLKSEFRVDGSPQGAPMQVRNSDTGLSEPLLHHLFKKVSDAGLLRIQALSYRPEDDPDRSSLKAFRLQVKEEIDRLENLIENYPIVLNAHSQGAVKSAVALRRLATVPYIRGDETSEKVVVSKQIYFVSYGGVAAMNEWGKGEQEWLKFKTFTHHLNIWDPARLVGMGRPFGFFLQDYTRPTFQELKKARDEQHHVFWHQRENPSENNKHFPLFGSFSWHRFWTYDCYIPVTKKQNPDASLKDEMDLEDLTRFTKDLPKYGTETKAEDSKQMCQPADK